MNDVIAEKLAATGISSYVDRSMMGEVVLAIAIFMTSEGIAPEDAKFQVVNGVLKLTWPACGRTCGAMQLR